jgi:hypothetical protein
MRIPALALSATGMVAAIGRHARSPIHSAAALAMGAIIFGLLVDPGFSTIAASCLGIALMLVVLTSVVCLQLATRHRLDRAQRTAAAVSVVDIGFMSVAVLLMPAHEAPRGGRQVSPMAGHASFADGAMTAGAMVWLVLLGWTICAAILLVPALRERSPAGPFHLVCSVSMIVTMAAMTAVAG